MSWREEYRYYAKCSGIAVSVVDKICDEVEIAHCFASPDEKYALAGERFWPIVRAREEAV